MELEDLPVEMGDFEPTLLLAATVEAVPETRGQRDILERQGFVKEAPGDIAQEAGEAGEAGEAAMGAVEVECLLEQHQKAEECK